MFSQPKKNPEAFQFIDELKDLSTEEWQKAEKKSSLNNRLTKLFTKRIQHNVSYQLQW